METDCSKIESMESRTSASVRPRMQAEGLQCLKLQIAVASPDPQTRAFPGTELSRKTQSPKIRWGYAYFSNYRTFKLKLLLLLLLLLPLLLLLLLLLILILLLLLLYNLWLQLQWLQSAGPMNDARIGCRVYIC